MSKIFEALQRGKGDIPELVIPAIEKEGLIPQQTFPEPSPVPADEPLLAPASAAVPSSGIASSDGPSPVSGARVLHLRISASTPLLPFDTTSFRASEEYRMIRTKIFQHPLQPKMIVISSAGPGDGKSVTAVNLAGALSLKAEAKVLLLDADIRRSSISRQLGLPSIAGLTDVLSGKCALEDAIVQTEQLPNLYVLTGGERTSNPAELLDSAAWVALCASLRKHFRYIIVDSPPMQAVADFDLIQAVCDGVIAVVRPDHTNKTVCEKALRNIPEERVIGIVLNCVKDWFVTKRDYYYAYRY